MSFYNLNTSANAFKGSFPKVLIKDLRGFPIRKINFDDPAEVAQHDKMVGFVEQMLALHKKLNGQKTSEFLENSEVSDARGLSPREKEMIQRQIEMVDSAIDRLVYALYGLTEEEIKIVEG